MDLENGPRRIQRRIISLYNGKKNAHDLARLEWQTEAPILDQGLIDHLDDWRRSVPGPRLVVIDVLQRIKPVGSATRNSYENDYAAQAPLQSWATEHGIGVVGLHQTKKGGADDPLEALSGSNGLSATADTTFLLDRNGDGISLYVRGRDVDEKQSALVVSARAWTVAGDAAKVRMSSERRSIIDALEGADEPLKPAEVADLTGMSSQAVRQSLSRMTPAGDVAKAGRGKYQPVTPTNPSSQSQSHSNRDDELAISKGQSLVEARCDNVTVVTGVLRGQALVLSHRARSVGYQSIKPATSVPVDQCASRRNERPF